MAESLLGDGQCGFAAAYLNLFAYLVVDKGVDVRLRMCLENGERVYHWYRQEMLVENTKVISMRATTREFPGLTDCGTAKCENYAKCENC